MGGFRRGEAPGSASGGRASVAGGRNHLSSNSTVAPRYRVRRTVLVLIPNGNLPVTPRAPSRKHQPVAFWNKGGWLGNKSSRCSRHVQPRLNQTRIWPSAQVEFFTSSLRRVSGPPPTASSMAPLHHRPGSAHHGANRALFGDGCPVCDASGHGPHVMDVMSLGRGSAVCTTAPPPSGQPKGDAGGAASFNPARPHD